MSESHGRSDDPSDPGSVSDPQPAPPIGDVHLAPWQAAEGAVVRVPRPPGGDPLRPTATIRIPAGVRDNTLLRVSPSDDATQTFLVRVRLAPWSGPSAGPSGARMFGTRPVTVTSLGPAAPRRRLGVLVWGAGGLALVLVAFLIARGGGGPSAPEARTSVPRQLAGATVPEATTTTPSEPTPTPTPLEPAAYRKAVAAVDAVLAKAFTGVRAARTPTAVSKAFGGFGAQLRAQAEVLRALVPPEPVAAAHSGVVTALEALADDLGGIEEARRDDAACGGVSAAAGVSSADSAGQVRAAAAALAAADPAQAYRIATFLPAKSAPTTRRLTNGYFMKAPRGGLGTMSISNGGDADSVVALTRSGGKSVVMRVYVRAGASTNVARIPDGVYQIYIASGQDWDATSGRFTRGCSFTRFDTMANFRTTSHTYTRETITLTPVLGGNARVVDVDPDDFPA